MAFLLVFSSLPLGMIVEAKESDNRNVWLGKFFDNHEFEGDAFEEEYDEIDFTWGKHNPLNENDSSLFSTILTSTIIGESNEKIRIQGVSAGEFVLYLNGVKVYEFADDNQLEFYTDIELQQGNNEIEVQYKNDPDEAKLKLEILSNVQNNQVESLEELPTDSWLANYYETLDLTGEMKEDFIGDLQLDGLDSFTNYIPLKNRFSASYERSFVVTKESTYNISGEVQGGIRVYVNEELLFEDWTDGLSKINSDFMLKEGSNQIRIEYKNDDELAPSIHLDVKAENLDEPEGSPEDGTTDGSEESPEDGTTDGSEESPEDGTTDGSEESPEDGTTDGSEGSPEDGTTDGSEGSPEDGSEESPEDGTTDGSEESPEDGTTDGSEESPEDGTTDGSEESPEDGTTDGSEESPEDGTTDGSEESPEDGTTDESEESPEDGTTDESEESSEDGTTDESEESNDAFSPSLFSVAKKTNNWTAEFYANTSFSGKPIVNTYEKLDLYWGAGSPHPSIPNDKFSAVFKKQLNVGETSFYRIEGRADDGIRVYVDNKLVINHWKNGVNHYKKDLLLTKGTHDIRVEYYDNLYSAAIKVDIKPIKEIVDGNWEAAYYPNGNFDGNPVIKKYSRLDLNWGTGSPDPKIPNDNFTATFHKKLKVTKAGDFLFEGRADDGIRVYVGNQLIIDQWKEGVNHYSKKVKLSAGEHLIRVEYFDKKYSAAISLDIAESTTSPDAWTATYYPTKDFKGKAVTRSVQNLDLNWGAGSPAIGIPSDNFSAVFEKRLNVQKSGTYHITGRADDGVRVYIDGKLVVNAWKNGINQLDHLVELTQGTHHIKVEYYDEKYSAAIKLDIKEAAKPKDAWLATYYPTKTFTGTPVKRYEQNLDLNWKAESPDPSIPNDNFSAIFEKEIQITQAGVYQFSGRADDGIRIYVNGKKVLDSWRNGVNQFSQNVDLAAGKHKVKVEYYDEKYSAAIKLDIKKATKQTIYKKTKYNTTFNEALNKQMKVSPQTDKKYNAYISKPALVTSNNNKIGTVQGGPWNVRGFPGTGSSSWVLGQLTNGSKVSIFNEVSDPTGSKWYHINFTKSWVNASRADVAYYMNPANFAVNSKEYYQFLSLKGSASISEKEVNDKILAGKGILQGKASSFAEASKVHGVNEIYLISHALLETGNGGSELAKGVLVTSVDGKPVTPKVVYNAYGIGANDNCALKCGSEYAYKMNWTSPEAAIVGGASFISRNYIHAGQDTLYKMRWNPAVPATHQYATDIGWAAKQTNRMYQFYSMLDTYTLTFDVPEYR